MNQTIFRELSLDRKKVKWVDYLDKLTPITTEQDEDPLTGEVSRMSFKREDFFAPLGYGGINGSKLRQCIWLAKRANQAGFRRVVNGTVVGSPQSPMTAASFRHFGIDTVTVLGASRPHSCIKHPMIEMAAWFGSQFAFVGSAYNSTIQPYCKHLQKLEQSSYLEYGITLDHAKNPEDEVHQFHSVGGRQVRNIPKRVNDLIVPFGSANSACSILTGILEQGETSLDRIHLIGIGPSKMKYLEERINFIARRLGYVDGFSYLKRWVEIKTVDLHGKGWAKYSDMMPESFGDIQFHPRYEGKCIRFLRQNSPELIKESSLFWIVGSEPTIHPMKSYCPELGEIPKSIIQYEEII